MDIDQDTAPQWTERSGLKEQIAAIQHKVCKGSVLIKQSFARPGEAGLKFFANTLRFEFWSPVLMLGRRLFFFLECDNVPLVVDGAVGFPGWKLDEVTGCDPIGDAVRADAQRGRTAG